MIRSTLFRRNIFFVGSRAQNSFQFVKAKAKLAALSAFAQSMQLSRQDQPISR